MFRKEQWFVWGKKREGHGEAVKERQISGAEVEVRAKWRGRETQYVLLQAGARTAFPAETLSEDLSAVPSWDLHVPGPKTS